METPEGAEPPEIKDTQTGFIQTSSASLIILQWVGVQHQTCISTDGGRPQ